jgi:oligopeptidase A
MASAAHVLNGGSRFMHAQPSVAAATCSMSASAVANPLLDAAYFPRFADVRAEHVTPAMDAALAQATERLSVLEGEIETILARGATPTYNLLADGLETLEETYAAPWRTICHLKAVKDSDELRVAHAAAEPKVVEFDSRLGQSRAFYRGWEKLKVDATVWSGLTAAQRRVCELMILGAELKGVGLDGVKKERFNAIEQELAALSTSFNNNLMDSIKAWSVTLGAESQVAGLPPSAKSMLAANARARGEAAASAEAGPWVVTLDAPCMLAVLRFADDRALRENVYRAYITRASELAADVPAEARAAQDNGPLIAKILALRAERAGLLGRRSHAEVSVASKMASVDGARSLLDQLREKSLEPARAEHAALEAFARTEGTGAQAESLRQWDVAYWSEKLKMRAYDFDEEAVRQFLPLDRVLAGLFALVENLFGVTIREVQPAAVGAQMWDPAVKLLEVQRAGKPAAYIFVDPFARAAEKRGGAWMSQVRQRSRALSLDGGKTALLPIAHIVCNQAPPTVGADGVEVPSLMSFSECRTMFHGRRARAAQPQRARAHRDSLALLLTFAPRLPRFPPRLALRRRAPFRRDGPRAAARAHAGRRGPRLRDRRRRVGRRRGALAVHGELARAAECPALDGQALVDRRADPDRAHQQDQGGRHVPRGVDDGSPAQARAHRYRAARRLCSRRRRRAPDDLGRRAQRRGAHARARAARRRPLPLLVPAHFCGRIFRGILLVQVG